MKDRIYVEVQATQGKPGSRISIGVTLYKGGPKHGQSFATLVLDGEELLSILAGFRGIAEFNQWETVDGGKL